MIPIINILLIVGILLFILYNLYVDTRNWSNTGSFLEGMASKEKVINNFFADKTINQNVSGSQKLFETAEKTIPEDIGDKVELEYEFKVRDQGWGNATYGKMAIVNITQNKTTNLKSGRGRGTQVHSGVVDITQYVNPGDKVKLRFSTSRYTYGHSMYWFYYKNLNLKYISNHIEPAYPRWQVVPNKSIQFQGSERGTNDKDIKGKSVDDALNELYPLNSSSNRENVWAIERNEAQKWTIFRTRLANGEIPQHTQVDSQGWAIHLNPDEPTKATATPAATSATDLPQSGAGTAGDAMENQIRSRAGNVAPMDSNVPQNCKKGCVAPTGPSGNCKVIQKDGVEKRECDYGCPVPSFIRGDTENCKYDRDCNSCGTVLFNPDDPPQMPSSGRPVDGENTNSLAGSKINVPGIQNAPGLNPQGQMGQTNSGSMGQMGSSINTNNSMGSMEMGAMGINTGSSNVATVATASNTLFNENIMKQVLEKKDLIPNDINKNNEETSFNLRIGKKFMVDTASIRNFAIPNIDNQDYIELGRIVKNIKMREKDPQESQQVKVLYSKLNSFVLELLTDSSLDMSGYDNNGVPTQLNNKTRTTGMFGENSNSLITDTDTDKVKENVKRQKVQPFNSIWSLYQ